MSVLALEDPFDARLARGVGGLLGTFNAGGVLSAADVHVASRLGALAGESEEAVLLAVALAVRAPRLGHVHVDLRRIRDTVVVESDELAAPAELPWPEPDAWVERVSACALAQGPLHLEGSRLYLDRYWREERAVAAALLARAADPPPDIDDGALTAALGQVFAGAGPEADEQRLAATSAVLRRLAVIAGGPGTGKTTTVARVLALLHALARAQGVPPPRVALAAPTGKAAARLQQAVHDEAGALGDPDAAAWLRTLSAGTVHRLLGRRPDTGSRFRHDARRPLPHDLVIVDETSMVSLSLMARLIDALRPPARLVLVGDPGQLASIEAGAVLGDIVGPAARTPLMSPATRARLQTLTGVAVPASDAPPGPAIGDGIVALHHVHRFGGAIDELAEAVRAGDGDRVLALLAAGADTVRWLDTAAEDPAALEPVRSRAVAAATAVVEAARAGDGAAALRALGRFRLLCAHRRGGAGVAGWSARIERWLADALPGFAPEERWYIGRPLLVTENDYELGLFNGDTGVVVAQADRRPAAVFERRGELVELSPARLGSVETLWAMTIHKSQGSQFDLAAVLLPDPSARLLSRELLYTALTRARQGLIVAGSEAAIRAAVARPIARSSGLRERLWEPEGTGATSSPAPA